MASTDIQHGTLRDRIAAELEAARGQTLAMLEPLPDRALVRQVSPIMSPLVWDLAHVGYIEEFWLLRGLRGEPAFDAGYDDLYDAFRHGRAERSSLGLLEPARARAYLAAVRARVLDALETAELDGEDPLCRDGFAHGMVIQHEHQHQETMLATLALMEDLAYPLPPAPVRRAAAPRRALEMAGGSAVIGSDDEPWAYDNERRAHAVELRPYRLDSTPVTNGDWMEFIAAGGYEEPSLWRGEGRRWREQSGLRAPGSWRDEGGGSWSRLRFGRREPVPREDPVQHISFFEADAFARFAGARLPTEAEWEAAATDALREKRRYPWGDEDPAPEQANLGVRSFAPLAAGSYPEGASADGCLALVGDVWEWTASGFEPYPGFRAFPYREYSEVFFGGDYRVLRGGSWATHATAVRGTFRNWDHPVRRQIFAGVRLAHDA